MNAIDIFAIPSLIEDVPKGPGVYIIRSKYDEILYIGKAKVLRNRIRSYLNSNNLDFFKSSMVKEAKSVEFIVTNSELEAFLLESNLIKEERPPYNIVLRDDKSYPYLRISMSEKFPRIFIVRRIKIKGDFYFGPVTPVEKLRELIRALKSTYKIAQKSDIKCQGAKNYCIYYQMGKCSAPCVGFISKNEYIKMIGEIKSILLNPKHFKGSLKKKLNKLIEKEEFEEAIITRNKLRALELLENKQNVSGLSEKFSDIVVFIKRDMLICAYILSIRFSNITGSRKYFFYNSDLNDETIDNFLMQYYSSEIIPDTIILEKANSVDVLKRVLSKDKNVSIVVPKKGQKKKLVEIAKRNAEISIVQHIAQINNNIAIFKSISDVFKLDFKPSIIDVIDISHTSFENVVSGVIRYSVSGFERDFYRRYKLSAKFEYEAMQEVTRRHMELLSKSKKLIPDIFLVDGGLIQLKAVSMETSIPTIGIAKEKINGKSIRSKGDATDTIYFRGTKMNVSSSVMFFFQKLRDEAHRFALEYHRKKRSQYIIASILDRVEFIGEKRKKALFDKFGTVENIKNASVEEIAAIKGISLRVAQLIKNKLKNYEAL